MEGGDLFILVNNKVKKALAFLPCVKKLFIFFGFSLVPHNPLSLSLPPLSLSHIQMHTLFSLSRERGDISFPFFLRH
ncbi:hypothetical protein HanRHA438_Chr17g0838591 [Helianthus annuus]|nr:hypothetical protein HanRHA438_Chr17g0838591 [Helianthus annuus]